ncbi:hypothetical protein [Sandaracinus amylolyticus]|uniref:hypothetical protein n=1 Tax=Sandaracinus amylolyticus TaxID=927083 RepID=UPI001F1C040A|nr:hypothetical protein [Sandaracinus amylolyticus]UJR82500.1 Hypothetical protein I5071_45650 [Sandaracinus amylolyticus]
MHHRCALLVVAMCSLAACGDDDDATGSDAGRDSGSQVADGGDDAGLDGGPADSGATDASDSAVDAATDGGSSRCPPLAARTVIDVAEGVLASDHTWTCDHVYSLNGIVAVHSPDPGAPRVLTIEPGTVIRGATGLGVLLVTRNGRLEAEGTAEDPIVFTSARDEGARRPGDWGGITLIGRAAPSRNPEGFPLSTSSISEADLAGYLEDGPIGAEPDPSWECGTLRYVRVEFASFNRGGSGNETNGIQLYSCGHGTRLDHVQSHLSDDDGIEVFGGEPDISHVVITGAADELFDYDYAFRGRVQFLVGQQHPGTNAESDGIEAADGARAAAPRIFNITLIGTNVGGSPNGQVGLFLRGNHTGTIANAIVLGFGGGVIDIVGDAASANLQATPATFVISHSIVAQGGAATLFPAGGGGADMIDEQSFFTAAERAIQSADPMLAAPFDTATPDWAPTAGAPVGASHAVSPSENDGETRPAFFDTSADYVGAFAPDGDDWTAGWTAFPAS